MILDLGVLSSVELKALQKAVDEERKRRGRRSPTKHEAPIWVVPKKAVSKENSQAA